LSCVKGIFLLSFLEVKVPCKSDSIHFEKIKIQVKKKDYMKIEKVTTADAKELLEIYAPYVEDTAISFEYQVPSLEEFTRRIETISARYPYIKALDEKCEILGYAYAAAFKSRDAYDWSVETTIYVRQDKHKMGIGRQLYEELEVKLKDMGILNMNACIAMPKGSDSHLTDASVRFHKKLGFQLVGTFHDSGYKFKTWYDMVWMEKMIGSHREDQKPVAFYNK